MTENNEALFGPAFPSDYANDDIIVFREDGVQRSGTVIQCCAPMSLPSGKQLGVHYIVDCGDGFPHVVQASQIIREDTKHVL